MDGDGAKRKDEGDSTRSDRHVVVCCLGGVVRLQNQQIKLPGNKRKPEMFQSQLLRKSFDPTIQIGSETHAR